MSTNLVIACYFGPRRCEFQPQKSDRMLFVREQLTQLHGNAHTLDQITFVFNEDDQTRSTCDQAELQIPREIGGTRVVVLRRPNDLGLSYGAWTYAAQMFPTFELTIVTEDDYLFARPYFDRKLRELLASDPDAAFVCGMVAPTHTREGHAAISTGILRTVVARELDVSAAVRDRRVVAQVVWSEEISRFGRIKDWLHYYPSAYWNDRWVRWLEREPAERLADSKHDPNPMNIEPTKFTGAFVLPVQGIYGRPWFHYWRGDGWVKRQGAMSRNGTTILVGEEAI